LLGNVLSEYEVEDKKQVAEFDPSAWIEDEEEEEPAQPCPVCGGTDQEEVRIIPYNYIVIESRDGIS
tara:strand:+ start:551 stop:751 length:201 start_codon:yes stop_codon:yes gene_type:complete